MRFFEKLVVAYFFLGHPVHTTYRVAQKNKPLPNYQKIVLKPVNEIRLIRQIKVLIKHCNSIRRH